jgi:hypothetical protein
MNVLDMEADMVPLLLTKTFTVCECGRVDTRDWLGTTHIRTSEDRASGEPNHTEVPGEPSRTWPSPARGAPHTDEFGSLEP